MLITTIQLSKLDKRKAGFVRLWNHLSKQTSAEIFKILRRMKPRRISHLLEFMHQVCVHDETVEYSQERLERFQDVLICCPRYILTKFLRSIDNQSVVNLLERRVDIWTKFFTGLLNSDIGMWLNFLRIVYNNDFDFISNVISQFIREASMNDLPLQLRQNIFNFVGRYPIMALLFVEQQYAEQSRTVQDGVHRMNEWLRSFAQLNQLEPVPECTIADVGIIEEEPLHREVDAEAFVFRTCPSLHPLAQNREYVCGVCRCDKNEPNDDDSMRIFRSMPCCLQQMACHGCLVRCATSCNTPDPENEFKDTNVFVCPFCRAERKFFLDEN
jgi:hypothetical protein